MREILKMMKEMEKEPCFSQTMKDMKDSLKMIKQMEMEYFILKEAKFQANGLQTNTLNFERGLFI